MSFELPSASTPTLSFEFFPPKTDEGWSDLRQTLLASDDLGLDFVSVTYGAGGSTREKTVDLCSEIHRDHGLDVMAHLTCVGHSREEIDRVLDQLAVAGVQTILGLRGDPPKGQSDFVPHPDGFAHASDLLAHIARRGGFRTACAFYPEIHPEATSAASDLEFLKLKQDNGASFAVSQLFYDVDAFLSFRDQARAAGVSIPLVAGVMPIGSLAAARRFVKHVPESVVSAIEAAGSEPAAIAEAGIVQATEMIVRLVSEGVEGIHLYTLNKSTASPRIVGSLRERGLFPRV
ncbi:MAG: methylenetetrahydrofolate reductase [Fibrobacteria bacterium]|nr:methylenetetrahydrofolate reductase [Fibrobacteria bacterium]